MITQVKHRFIASILGNFLRSLISFATGLLLARWLGITEYGQMSFLLAAFTSLRGLLDLGTSSAFFTFLSQRKRSIKFIRLFWVWIFLQFLLASFAVLFFLPDSFLVNIWKSNDRILLILAFFATFMQGSVWNLAAQMAEASRSTIKLQKLNTFVVFIHLMAIFFLWRFDWLALPFIFVITAIEWGIASWIASKMYIIGDTFSVDDSYPHNESIYSILREFVIFCRPLFIYTWISFLYEFVDRWMLQTWGGDSEQAYFGVAQQFSAIALLATTSILRVFWKEIAEAHHVGNLEVVEALYLRVSKLVYFFGAVIAGGLMPWAADILRITVGDQYIAGAATLAILLAYPMHQSIGQIGGTMAYATNNAHIQVKVGLLFMPISLMIVYFFLAPTNAAIPGFGLGSEGLAIKMILVQFLSVNALNWQLSKILKIKFDVMYQLISFLVCMGIGWLIAILMQALFGKLFSPLGLMIISCPLYMAGILTYVFFKPSVLGFSKKEIISIFQLRFLKS